MARIDFVAGRGAAIMRLAATFTLAGAAAATLAAFSALGLVGWIIGAASFVPGFVLWRYATRLDGALDVDRIRNQLGTAGETARGRLGEVVDGIRDSRRAPLRSGFRVLRTMRGLRSDLADFGIDITGIAEVANPAVALVAALSLVSGFVLWVVAAIGLLLRLVL